VNPGRLFLSFAGLAGSGALIYLGLKSNGIIEPQRGEGASFILDTFTTTGTKEDFIRSVMSAAARADSSLPSQTRLLLAVWAAHESGWGKTKQAKEAFNLWNISAGSAWLNAKKPVQAGNDTEFTPGSAEAKKIRQWWRKYPTLDASVSDMLSFLKNSGYVNYREAYQQLLNGETRFVETLGVFERAPDKTIIRVENRPNTAGFYTMPRSEYLASTNKLLVEGRAIVTKAAIAGLMSGTQS
jgi:hypothetical protein